MRDYLIINGRNLKEFGVYAYGNSIHDFPERVVEKISVLGRTGDLLVDKGKWENIDVEYSMVLLDGANLDYLKAFLLSLRGYVRIESTFEPDYYRMGRFLDASSPKVHKEAATVTLTFDCKPQKYLKSGENELCRLGTNYETQVTIHNPTMYTAKPLLKVAAENTVQTATFSVTNYVNIVNSGGGTGSIDVGHSVVTIKRTPGKFICIDCESGMAYDDAWGESLMDAIVSVDGGDFPQIMQKRYNGEPLNQSGDTRRFVQDSYTVIEAGEGMYFISVTPRWWTL